jgi:ubiquinone/menaquinone biosynthesis C-methylase UbiE
MINRRNLVGATGASIALTSMLLGSSTAAAAEAVGARVEPRGRDGRLTRLGSLDLESQQDFTLGFRLMQAKKLRQQSEKAFLRLLKTKKIDPLEPMTMDEVRLLADEEPLINVASKAWLINQQITWKTLRDYFHANTDAYLSEMDAADRAGPGSLALNPQMTIPEYARNEIHIQPGGYVGDDFAGYMYHYGTNSFYISVMGHNDQDQIHKSVANRLPLPADGRVKRILDVGCGIGQMTTALKERFPDAEVWGLEVGAPMVRYAHTRARGMGMDVNFVQGLAETTQFPDKHFDLVTSYIMHHEVPAEITKKIIVETQRITRPGGIYYPVDFSSGGVKAVPWSMYQRWWDHRWNNEVWSREYHSIVFNDEIAARGFSAAKTPAVALPGFGVRHFIRA